MAQKPEVIDVRQFTGLNTIDDPTVIDPGASPYMLNMNVTNSGGVQSRFGYEEVANISGAGGMSGAIPYYRTYGSNSGDYLVVFYNGTAYYWQNGDTSFTSIGSYGTDNGLVRGAVINNYLVFGNGLAANTPKKWDASTLANLSGTPPDVSIFGVYAKRLFAAGVESATSRVNYSDTDTEDTNLSSNFINISIGDGEDVTALVPNRDALIVFKTDSIHAINYSFDSSYNITVPQQQPIITSKGGCVATGSAEPVYGYTYFLSRKGFESYGLNSDFDFNLPVPLSLLIEPSVREINYNKANLIDSAFFNQKYICAVPYNKSDKNNLVFVMDEAVKRRFGIDNWVAWDGIPAAQFAVFRDSNKRDQLYFVSNTEPKLFKFNESYSDDGVGYNRIWTSKTFQYGENTNWDYLDIEGSMTLDATIYVDIVTDGVEYNGIEIDSSNFISSGIGGGYIGDSYSGSSYIGNGNEANSGVQLYKFKKRIYFPDTVNYGYNMYFRIRNQANGEGWKLTRYKLVSKPKVDDPTYPYTD